MMSSPRISSDLSSIRPASIHSSILNRIPRGYRLTQVQSDTNSTLSGILGPGRVVGAVISSAGKRLERVIDRFAEERLGLGPNMAALRLISALHDIHVNIRFGRCASEQTEVAERSSHITDQLIWVCNGFCSQCHTAYLPQILTDLPDAVRKAFEQLIKYLYSRSISNIALAAVYMCLIAQSTILSVSLIEDLALLDVLNRTREVVLYRQSLDDSVVDIGFAVQIAMSSFRQQNLGVVNLGSLTRLRVEDSEDPELLSMLKFYLRNPPKSSHWAAKEIFYAQILTVLSVLVIHHVGYRHILPLEQLLELVVGTQHLPELPRYLINRSAVLHSRIASRYVSKTAKYFIGHNDWVESVAFSPDDTHIVSGSRDHTVRLWNTRGELQVLVLKGHTGRVRSVAFSPDGTRIASGSFDWTVRLWDPRSGTCTQMITGHRDQVWSVAFSHDGKHLASCSADRTLQLWDLETGRSRHRLNGHTGWVKSVALSADGQYLASGADDQSVRLWDAMSGGQIAVLRGHTDWSLCVAFSPNGALIASGSADKTVRLWDVGTGSSYTTLRGHSEWVRSIAFSPDGSYLVSGSEDWTVRLWEVSNGLEMAILLGNGATVRSVTFSRCGKRVLAGLEDNTMMIWDVQILIGAHAG